MFLARRVAALLIIAHKPSRLAHVPSLLVVLSASVNNTAITQARVVKDGKAQTVVVTRSAELS